MSINLIVPGIGNSSSQHWQSLWEKQFPDNFSRIEQEVWDTPTCSDWIETIEKAVCRHDVSEVILIAPSLGCVAVNHWAKRFGTPIKGALLVAPSDCEAATYTFDTKGFAPIPLDKLSFKSVVVASTNDYYVSFERAKHFAESWGSELVNIGAKDHINADAGFGEWQEGLEFLKKLN